MENIKWNLSECVVQLQGAGFLISKANYSLERTINHNDQWWLSQVPSFDKKTFITSFPTNPTNVKQALYLVDPVLFCVFVLVKDEYIIDCFELRLSNGYFGGLLN